MFKKGQSGNLKGRPKGTLNDPRVSDLRVMLHNAFVRNQSAALAKIDQMFQGEDMNDFKFILTLKASLEPKKLEHSGEIALNSKNLLEAVKDAEARSLTRVTIPSAN